MRTPDGTVRTIRNVVWDVDGTLFDTYPAISRAFRAALREFGQDASLGRIVALARDSRPTPIRGNRSGRIQRDHRTPRPGS
jgi:phosphoglycolate phosphatase-like HAD superfamily hydrolase